MNHGVPFAAGFPSPNYPKSGLGKARPAFESIPSEKVGFAAFFRKTFKGNPTIFRGNLWGRDLGLSLDSSFSEVSISFYFWVTFLMFRAKIA
jgi:hypothetical protein